MTNTECCPLLKCTMDHCVQLVGYNTTASTPYYMVRNSWATDWGVYVLYLPFILTNPLFSLSHVIYIPIVLIVVMQ